MEKERKDEYGEAVESAKEELHARYMTERVWARAMEILLERRQGK